MNLWEKLKSVFRAPVLSRARMVLALVIAVATDGLQFLTNAAGWFGFDQAIDCVAMVLISWIIGVHILLLPTFVIELMPVLDDLPTWTACTAAVIVLRKREQRNRPSVMPDKPDKPVIDV